MSSVVRRPRGAKAVALISQAPCGGWLLARRAWLDQPGRFSAGRCFLGRLDHTAEPQRPAESAEKIKNSAASAFLGVSAVKNRARWNADVSSACAGGCGRDARVPSCGRDGHVPSAGGTRCHSEERGR